MKKLPVTQCVILAGGLGTRMKPYTENHPKALIPVNGIPFAQLQLEWLAREGVRDVVYCVGYRSQAIREFVGDGSRFGLRVSYVEDGKKLMGTGGALRCALDAGVLTERFFVTYGDSYLPISLAEVCANPGSMSSDALMVVFKNDNRFDKSNVVFRDGQIIRYEKGAPGPEVVYIDYGLTVLSRSLITQRVPNGQPVDLASVLTELSREGKLAGHVAHERFYEVGSVQGLKDLESYLEGREAASSLGGGR